jgi:DNA-binding transcriptional MerR regulator
MKLKINEAAKLTGVSVRTLHYYDQIGLLHPDETTEAGYRLYGGDSMERLQQILFFRELGFALKDIREIMNDPAFDRARALENHRRLLVLQRDRLEKLIALVDRTMKGESHMSFQEFDMSEVEETKKKYAEEVKERWGKTEAYAESARRTKNYSKEDWARIGAEQETLCRAFADAMGKGPDSPEAQRLTAEWQNLITRSFYPCSDEILAGLGEMYAADERFTKNIDRFGEGLADFISRAIRVYCKK